MATEKNSKHFSGHRAKINNINNKNRSHSLAEKNSKHRSSRHMKRCHKKIPFGHPA